MKAQNGQTSRDARQAAEHAPRLLRTFLIYILPILVLSIAGMVYSINRSIDSAIEAYQVMLDRGVAEEALVMFRGLEEGPGIMEINADTLAPQVSHFVEEENINCFAIFNRAGTLLKLLKFNAACRAPRPDIFARVNKTGQPHLVESGMIRDDWTTVLQLPIGMGANGPGSDPQSGSSGSELIAISRDAKSREQKVHLIALDWTVVFGALLALACLATLVLVMKAQGMLDRAFNQLAEVEHRLARFVSRSALAYAHGEGKTARRFEATILFADLHDFSGYSEKVDPETTASLVDEFVSIGTAQIERFCGDVDKILGDGFLAWFEGKDSLDQAMSAAGGIISNSAGLARRPGIGIMKGEVVSISVGKGERRDFTILGRTVNLAARLCGVTGENEVAMSQHDYNSLTQPVTLLDMSNMHLKNHEEPVMVCRVIPVTA